MPILKKFLVVCKSCQSPHINMVVNHHIPEVTSFDISYFCPTCKNSESVHFDPPIINRKEAIQQMVEAARVAQS